MNSTIILNRGSEVPEAYHETICRTVSSFDNDDAYGTDLDIDIDDPSVVPVDRNQF